MHKTLQNSANNRKDTTDTFPQDDRQQYKTYLRCRACISHVIFLIISYRSLPMNCFNVVSITVCPAMDHRVFQFATRGQCIKGKKLDCFEHNHIFCFNCNVLALLSFYALPSGGNRKTWWSILKYNLGMTLLQIGIGMNHLKQYFLCFQSMAKGHTYPFATPRFLVEGQQFIFREESNPLPSIPSMII